MADLGNISAAVRHAVPFSPPNVTPAAIANGDGELSAAVPQLITAAAANAGDPFWPFVTCLLQFDGADGSTSIIDAATNEVWSVAGSAAQIDTAQSVFGGASLLLNGASEYIIPTTSASTLAVRRWNLADLDFTVEMFFRPTSVSVLQTFIDGWNTYGFGIQILATGQLQGYIYTDTVTVLMPTAGAITAGVWHHVALVRAGGTAMLFLDGVRMGAAAISGYIPHMGSDPLTIGRDSSASRYFGGHIDSVRITRGVARYRNNFTVPASAFPAFQGGAAMPTARKVRNGRLSGDGRTLPASGWWAFPG